MKLKDFMEVYDDAYLVVIDEPIKTVYCNGDDKCWDEMGYAFNFVEVIPDFLYERFVHYITAYEIKNITYFFVELK